MTNKLIGVESPEDLKKKTAKPWCSFCGVDQSATRDPQLLARRRFDHHHHCPEHPLMQWERTKLLAQMAATILPKHIDSASIEAATEGFTHYMRMEPRRKAIQDAEELLAEIERRNLGSDELINTSPEKLRENGGRKA